MRCAKVAHHARRATSIIKPGLPGQVGQRVVLRRFLEHEREHTAQVQEILATWRAHLLARLAAERARLLWQFVGLDRRTLTKSPVFDD